MELLAPLSSAQIAAAGRLYQGLPQWAASDRALVALGERFPAFDLESALLKVAALNQLYGTNVYAANRIAHHIVRLMSEYTQVDDPVALAEDIARLPLAAPGETPRLLISFASKFCHF